MFNLAKISNIKKYNTQNHKKNELFNYFSLFFYITNRLQQNEQALPPNLVSRA